MLKEQADDVRLHINERVWFLSPFSFVCHWE